MAKGSGVRMEIEPHATKWSQASYVTGVEERIVYASSPFKALSRRSEALRNNVTWVWETRQQHFSFFSADALSGCESGEANVEAMGETTIRAQNMAQQLGNWFVVRHGSDIAFIVNACLHHHIFVKPKERRCRKGGLFWNGIGKENTILIAPPSSFCFLFYSDFSLHECRVNLCRKMSINVLYFSENAQAHLKKNIKK